MGEMPPARRIRAYIGLGANIGDAAGTLARAVHALDALGQSRVAAVSRLYVTAPVGVTDQADFHNAVAALETTYRGEPASAAIELLASLKGIERNFGRRGGRRWGPRELDLDLLLFGRARLTLERPPAGVSLDAGKADNLLVVPHRDARERLFVLEPLADLAPGLVPPGWGETVGRARDRRRQEEGPAAARAVARWDGTGWAPLAVDGPDATSPNSPRRVPRRQVPPGR